MKVSFRFFDKEEWSIYTLLLSIIIIIIFALGYRYINIFQLKILVLMSLIAMIEADLLPKLIFIFFMCMICFNKDEFIIGTILALVSGLITYYIPRKNVIVQLFNNNIILKYIFRFIIFLWFLIVIYFFTLYTF